MGHLTITPCLSCHTWGKGMLSCHTRYQIVFYRTTIYQLAVSSSITVNWYQILLIISGIFGNKRLYMIHVVDIFNAPFLYARLKNGRIMLWQCPSVCLSVRPSVRPSFSDFFSTCFEISIWNLVYAFSRWHDMSSLSFITIGSLWPSLQPQVGQTEFLQSWPYKSR